MSKLLLLACSATKLATPAPALQLYRGVMYSTLRARARPGALPRVIILSAKHGFICHDTPITPYNVAMSRDRADAMLADLSQAMGKAQWPGHASSVLLAGGQHYRRVMRAAVDRMAWAGCTIEETSGGIGMQRQQLGGYLERVANGSGPPEQIGCHSNGTPCYRQIGPFSIGDRVVHAYPHQPGVPSYWATVRELFVGPAGPTALADVEEVTHGRVKIVSRWIALDHLRLPGAPSLAPIFFEGNGASEKRFLVGEPTFSI